MLGEGWARFARDDVHPSKMQEPSSIVTLEKKLRAWEEEHPATLGRQDPSLKSVANKDPSDKRREGEGRWKRRSDRRGSKEGDGAGSVNGEGQWKCG